MACLDYGNATSCCSITARPLNSFMSNINLLCKLITEAYVLGSVCLCPRQPSPSISLIACACELSTKNLFLPIKCICSIGISTHLNSILHFRRNIVILVVDGLVHVSIFKKILCDD